MGVQLKYFPDSKPFPIEELKNATASSDGAMSAADKAKLDGILPRDGAFELTFGAIFSIAFNQPLNSVIAFWSNSAVERGSPPNNILDSKRINNPHTLNKFGVTIPTRFDDDTVVEVALYYSIDDGQSYHRVGVVDLHDGKQSGVLTFGPTEFSAGTLFCVSAQTDGNSVACAITATVSRS